MKFISTIKARLAAVTRFASDLRSITSIAKEQVALLKQVNMLECIIEELHEEIDELKCLQVTEDQVEGRVEECIAEQFDIDEICRIVAESHDLEESVNESVNSYFADSDIRDLLHQIIDHCDFEYKVEKLAISTLKSVIASIRED